jgi:hypothetical protein
MSDSPFFRILLAVVPVLTATLYLMGLSFHEGFLDIYGVDSSLFPLASDTALLQGFFTLLLIGALPILNKFYVVLLLFALVVLAAILSSHSRVKAIQSKIAVRLQKCMPSKEISGILDKSSTGYIYIVGIFLLIFLPFYIASLSIQSGQQQAKLNMEEFNNQTGKWVMLHSSHSTSPVRVQ